jgi:hypothetical protein
MTYPQISCSEFQDWLERLPRRVLSPAFSNHLKTCPQCQRDWEELDSVAEKLLDIPQEKQLSEESLKNLMDSTEQNLMRRQNNQLMFKLVIMAVLCLPLMAFIDWIWTSTGYAILANVISPGLAQIYLIISICSAIGISGVFYGSIPLLVGLFRRDSLIGERYEQ